MKQRSERGGVLTTTAGLALSLFLMIVAASAIPFVSELQSQDQRHLRSSGAPSLDSFLGRAGARR